MKIGLVSPYDWSYPGGVRDHLRDDHGHEENAAADDVRDDDRRRVERGQPPFELHAGGVAHAEDRRS